MKHYRTHIFKINRDHTLDTSGITTRNKSNVFKHDCVIYIYYGNHDIYIGQTIHFYNRHDEHNEDPKFNMNDFSHVITLYGEHVTKDSLDDIEHQLIMNFISDNDRQISRGKHFRIHNGNHGNTVIDYPDRRKVENVIRQFWQHELYSLHLVHHQDLKALKNSVLYKYSPFTKLGKHQKNVVKHVFHEKCNEIIEGDAGTGKTVVMVHLIALFVDKFKHNSLNIGVVVQANWRKNCKNIIDSYNLNNNVTYGSAYQIIKSRKKFSVILVDEAHRLKWPYGKQDHSQFDIYPKDDNGNPKMNINQLILLGRQTHRLILFYDKLQAIRPSDIPRKQFQCYIKMHNFNTHQLHYQYRIHINELNSNHEYNSKSYINGLLDLLQLRPNHKYNKKVFCDPSPGAYFGVVNSIPELFKYVDDQYQDKPTTIDRVLSGYYKKWRSHNKKSPSYYPYDWVIDDKHKYRWNSTNKNWVYRKGSRYEIGCIHSIQGVDLSYVGVIIGNDLGVKNGRLVGIKDNYYDINGIPAKKDFKNNKNLAQTEFNQFIKNIYYVLLTRGIDGIRVYFVNKSLRRYFCNKLKSL